jgi:hypothetical protein
MNKRNQTMAEIIVNKNLVSYCGLYCGACSKYLKDKCPGCHENEKASWCKIRTCCIKNSYQSCASCSQFEDANDCKKFNNFFSKLIGFFLRSDRKAGVDFINEKGIEEFAKYMSENKLVTIKE